MQSNPRGSSPSNYHSPPQGGDKRQFIEKQAKDAIEPQENTTHKEIEFRKLKSNFGWGEKLARKLFYIYFIYTQLCKTTILKSKKKMKLSATIRWQIKV